MVNFGYLQLNPGTIPELFRHARPYDLVVVPPHDFINNVESLEIIINVTSWVEPLRFLGRTDDESRGDDNHPVEGEAWRKFAKLKQSLGFFTKLSISLAEVDPTRTSKPWSARRDRINREKQFPARTDFGYGNIRIRRHLLGGPLVNPQPNQKTPF